VFHLKAFALEQFVLYLPNTAGDNIQRSEAIPGRNITTPICEITMTDVNRYPGRGRLSRLDTDSLSYIEVPEVLERLGPSHVLAYRAPCGTEIHVIFEWLRSTCVVQVVVAQNVIIRGQ
jgi:hypothetical protein